ncbi:hypothetical protein GCM10029978_041290 [Actinoallomurus acanthiterrae]
MPGVLTKMSHCFPVTVIVSTGGRADDDELAEDDDDAPAEAASVAPDLVRSAPAKA